MSEITRQDLERLNTLYWEIEKRGADWEEDAKSVSKIYYYCEANLKKEGVIESKFKPKVEHREKVRGHGSL